MRCRKCQPLFICNKSEGKGKATVIQTSMHTNQQKFLNLLGMQKLQISCCLQALILIAQLSVVTDQWMQFGCHFLVQVCYHHHWLVTNLMMLVVCSIIYYQHNQFAVLFVVSGTQLSHDLMQAANDHDSTREHLSKLEIEVIRETVRAGYNSSFFLQQIVVNYKEQSARIP